MQTFFLWNALTIVPDRKQSIAVVGGGGKTSLIFRLCEEMVSTGKKVIVTGNDLRRNNTKSCGCLNKEKYTERIKKQTVNHSNISSIKSKKISKKNTSGVRGVCPTKRGRWRAYIGHKGKNVFLGEFSKKEDAIAARRKAEEQFFIPILKKANQK